MEGYVLKIVLGRELWAAIQALLPFTKTSPAALAFMREVNRETAAKCFDAECQAYELYTPAGNLICRQDLKECDLVGERLAKYRHAKGICP